MSQEKPKKVEMPINKVKVRNTKVPVLPSTGIKKLFKVEPVKPPDNIRVLLKSKGILWS